jgi:peptide/nickel transport system permease protein
MLAYLLRRVILTLSIVWAVSFVCFVAFMRAFDPLWQFSLCGAKCRPQKDALIARFHLHGPILERYWLWLTGLFHHGFGDSVGGTPIGSFLFQELGVSAQLLGAALVLTVLFSVLLGVTSARRPGSLADGILRFFAYGFWAMPTFLTGIVLARLFVGTGWFLFESPDGGGAVRWVRVMALPAVTLSLGLIGAYSRYVRTLTLTELRQPYVTVARAKGLSERRVAYRHALRNALVPFVGLLSLEMTAIVGASLAADYVFGLNGLADVFYFYATKNPDPFVLTAIVAVIGAVVAFAMLLGELALGWLDPRLRVATG